jgi:hypothetical protein
MAHPRPLPATDTWLAESPGPQPSAPLAGRGWFVITRPTLTGQPPEQEVVFVRDLDAIYSEREGSGGHCEIHLRNRTPSMRETTESFAELLERLRLATDIH